MKRSPMKRRRRPIRPVSERRQAARDAAEPVVQAVFDRDHGCVAHRAPGTPPCRGRVTPHHLRKEGQGGLWSLDNLVTLCQGHNGWVEDQPDAAHALGLVIRRGEDITDAWQTMLAAELLVGSFVASCPGSLMPPRSTLRNTSTHGACSCCRYFERLVPAPDGGPGPVFGVHSWHAPTFGDGEGSTL